MASGAEVDGSDLGGRDRSLVPHGVHIRDLVREGEPGWVSAPVGSVSHVTIWHRCVASDVTQK